MIIVTTATAIATVKCVPPSELIYICKASGNVYCSTDFNIKTGQTYSFQDKMKNQMLVDVTAGLTSGNTISFIMRR